jgi:hypothetical protein
VVSQNNKEEEKNHDNIMEIQQLLGKTFYPMPILMEVEVIWVMRKGRLCKKSEIRARSMFNLT